MNLKANNKIDKYFLHITEAPIIHILLSHRRVHRDRLSRSTANISNVSRRKVMKRFASASVDRKTFCSFFDQLITEVIFQVKTHFLVPVSQI